VVGDTPSVSAVLSLNSPSKGTTDCTLEGSSNSSLPRRSPACTMLPVLLPCEIRPEALARSGMIIFMASSST